MNLPDPYSGELNTKRIKAYRALRTLYNLEESSIREIFSKGIEFYQNEVKEANKPSNLTKK